MPSIYIDRWKGVLLLVRKDCANVKFTTCFDKTHPFTENTLSFPVQIENLTLAKSSCVRVKVLRSSEQGSEYARWEDVTCCSGFLVVPTRMLYRVPKVSSGVAAPILRSPPSQATPRVRGHQAQLHAGQQGAAYRAEGEGRGGWSGHHDWHD